MLLKCTHYHLIVFKLNEIIDMPIAPVSLIIQPINTVQFFAKIVAISGSVPDESIPPVHIDIREDILIAPVINAQYIINIAAPFDYLSNITTSIILQHLKPHEMCHE
eukprot:317784_1